ncbi:MAG: E3 binding domain-containing protein, partial [Desulfuromonadaceae bacterium]|nr:E3 binding domain-containing protein [Desulfuromonadaceae bacterium]
MEIKIPEVGESVREALLAKWFKKSGDVVKRDEPLCEIETDKITLDLNADADGVLTISVTGGTTVAVGTVIGLIEESTVTAAPPVTTSATQMAEKPAIPPSSPSLRREMREQNISPDEVQGSGKGGRVTQEDLFARIEEKANMSHASSAEPAAVSPESLVVAPLPVQSIAVQPPPPAIPVPSEQSFVHTEEAPVYSGGREERRPMSPLRKRIGERLVAARQQTAI